MTELNNILLLQNAGRPEFSAKLGFNTPGSKIDRDIGFDFVFKTGDKVMDFSVRTPWKKVSVGGMCSFII